MLTPLSALRAFRQDLAANPDSATDHDARWLQVLSLLQSATDVHPSERAPILAVVADLAGADLRKPDGEPYPAPATFSAPIPREIDLALRSAMAMEDATRFQMAYAALDALLRLIPAALDPSSIVMIEVQGAILSFQGRVARQAGDLDGSLERYGAAEELASSHGSGAVMARAWAGYGRCAYTRGNLPQAREWFEKVLECEGAAPESVRVAHQSLMAIAAGATDYETAARHGWAAYELAPDDEDASSALCDLSELMRVSGRPRLALRGFAAALQRAPRTPRQRLAALGGAALAASQALPGEAARGIVLRYRAEIDAIIATTHLPYSHANALADLGDAFAVLGDAELCADSRARAKFIARAHGFYELLFRVTDDAIPVRGRNVLPIAGERETNRAERSSDGVQPVLEAIAAFAAPPEIEAALARQP